MRLKSADGQLGFRAFMRRYEDLPENVSIGLAFVPKDGTGEILLLRCNGPHGGYNDSFDPDHPHWDFHVARASAKRSRLHDRTGSAEAAVQRFHEDGDMVDIFIDESRNGSNKLRVGDLGMTLCG